MSDYREVHEQAREHGLKARQATRHERAIRRQVAEEIAQAIERWNNEDVGGDAYINTDKAAEIAREIGAKEGLMTSPHNHPPACCCPTDTCPVCAGTDVAAPGVGCIDIWHDEPPVIEQACPACPDHGRPRDHS